MNIEYQRHGVPLADYQLTRADHNRQEKAECIAAWVKKQLAKAPPPGDEQREIIDALLEGARERPSPERMLWRVRLYCGHIQEITRPLSSTRPDDGLSDEEACRECNIDHAIIVAFEPVHVVSGRDFAR